MAKASDYLTAEIIESVLQESDSEDDMEDEGFESPFNSENSGSDDDSTAYNSDHYISKNGLIKWHKNAYVEDASPNSEPVRKRSGVQFFAQHAITPFEAFILFFDNEVVDLILHYSNIYVRKHGERYGDTKEINKNELHAVIGLLLYWGVMKPYDSTQSNDSVDIYRMAMCKSRFRLIIKCLKFDDVEERKSNKLDCLSQISELIKLVVNNYQGVYVPSSCVSVFQHVIPFSGKFPHKYFSHSNRKSGIKITNLMDSRSSYYLSFEINRNEMHGSRSTSMKAALHLIDSVKDKCQDVITDEAHTSVALSIALKQLSINNKGKLTNDDKNVPKIFQKISDPQDSLFGFTDDLTLISHMSDSNQIQIYLSNKSQNTRSDFNATKIELINDIEKSQDTNNKFLLNFGGGRAIKRWPILIFSHLISTSQMNAHIVYNDNTRTKSTSEAEFVKQLSLSLIRKHMESRSFVSQIFRWYIPEDVRDKDKSNNNNPKE